MIGKKFSIQSLACSFQMKTDRLKAFDNFIGFFFQSHNVYQIRLSNSKRTFVKSYTMVFSSKSKKGSRNQGQKWMYEKSVKIKIYVTRKTVKNVIYKVKISHILCLYVNKLHFLKSRGTYFQTELNFVGDIFGVFHGRISGF